MANRTATILGTVFLLVGILGFVIPNLGGAHFSVAHNLVHIISGAVALWLGLKGSPQAAKTFCIVFGAVYLLLGIAGFVAGGAGEPSANIPHGNDTRLLKVIPGQLELGTMDHIVHILLGAIFLIGGLTTKTVVTRSEH